MHVSEGGVVYVMVRGEGAWLVEVALAADDVERVYHTRYVPAITSARTHTHTHTEKHEYARPSRERILVART